MNVYYIARAWASIDGKLEEFDRECRNPNIENDTGTYEGYMTEAVELVARAMGYEKNDKERS